MGLIQGRSPSGPGWRFPGLGRSYGRSRGLEPGEEIAQVEQAAGQRAAGLEILGPVASDGLVQSGGGEEGLDRFLRSPGGPGQRVAQGHEDGGPASP